MGSMSRYSSFLLRWSALMNTIAASLLWLAFERWHGLWRPQRTEPWPSELTWRCHLPPLSKFSSTAGHLGSL